LEDRRANHEDYAANASVWAEPPAPREKRGENAMSRAEIIWTFWLCPKPN
jgi:hypothetical protein